MRYLYSFVILILASHAAAAANITARLSHNPVSLDESFHLIYEADSTVDDDPDFSILTKDFEILSSSQSTNMRSINGKWSLKKSWDLALISKQAGVFTIPSVSFGKDSSPSVRVTVKPSTSNNMQGTSGKDAFFLKVTVDRSSAWVQSEIIYTIRFFTSIPINRPTLSEPETNDPDAIIEQLGQVANYQKMVNGMAYSVSELRFAVYPQHSGTLKFKPILFEGRLPRGRSNSLFDQFMQTGELKRMRSKPVSVNIKPKPANIASSAWLPAEDLVIEEDWSEDVSQLRTGEPVTRTLTIKATGLTAEQLHDLEITEVSGVKQYPDKPVTENQRKRDGITGIKQIKVAMIPTQAGTYRIPGITIPWWNTRTGKQEVARLPETVIEATGMASTQQMPQPIEMVPPPQTQASQAPADSTPVKAQASDEAIVNPAYWPWISLVLAIGWIATTIMLFRNGNAGRARGQAVTQIPILPLERAVENACSRGEAGIVKDALLEWARVRWPQLSTTSLADIAEASTGELRAQVHVLNSALYSPRHSDWDPAALRRAFQAFNSQKKNSTKTAESVLEPLYKT